jgi:antitoxin Phd
VEYETLIPVSKLVENPKYVLEIVDKFGHAVLLDNNAPAYVVSKPGLLPEITQTTGGTEKMPRYYLQDAMRIVLEEADGHQMHAADLADAVYNRRLYLQRDGGKATYNQMRARVGHYPEMFEALPGNIIRLREKR